MGMARIGSGTYERLFKTEEFALVTHSLPAHKQRKRLQHFVRSSPTLAGIDPAYLELVRVFSTYADAKRQAPGSHFSKGRKLTRHKYRMSQREQVHADRLPLGDHQVC